MLRPWFALVLCCLALELADWRGACAAEQTQRASPQSNAAITGFAEVCMVHSLMQNLPYGEVTVVQRPDDGQKRARSESAVSTWPVVDFRP